MMPGHSLKSLCVVQLYGKVAGDNHPFSNTFLITMAPRFHPSLLATVYGSILPHLLPHPPTYPSSYKPLQSIII